MTYKIEEAVKLQVMLADLHNFLQRIVIRQEDYQEANAQTWILISQQEPDIIINFRILWQTVEDVIYVEYCHTFETVADLLTKFQV